MPWPISECGEQHGDACRRLPMRRKAFGASGAARLGAAGLRARRAAGHVEAIDQPAGGGGAGLEEVRGG